MLPEQLDVQNVPVTQMRDLTMDLSGKLQEFEIPVGFIFLYPLF